MKYNTFNYNYLRRLNNSFINILCLLFIIYISIKSFTNLLDSNTIYCIDNNNEDWRNIRIGIDLGTLYNVGVNGGFSYAAIYIVRSLFPNNPLNINFYIGNNGGNRFNSPLEYGEALDSSSVFIDSMIGLNLIILLFFNLLIMVLVNKTIVPYILNWLQNKINTNNIVYKMIERIYKANMKISIWLIGYIIIMIYILIFIDLWGITRIKLAINMIIENIDNIFPK